MAAGSFQTLRPARFTRSPSLLTRTRGAEAVTQLGQTGRDLVPSLMDGRPCRPPAPQCACLPRASNHARQCRGMPGWAPTVRSQPRRASPRSAQIPSAQAATPRLRHPLCAAGLAKRLVWTAQGRQGHPARQEDKRAPQTSWPPSPGAGLGSPVLNLGALSIIHDTLPGL